MPPIVAAFLCIVFIVVIWVTDAKRKPDVGITYWAPFIWFLIVSSRPLAAWFTFGTSPADFETGDPGSSRIDAVTLSILLSIGFLILLLRKEKVEQLLRNNKWLIVMALYCFASIMWSDYPSVSFKRWIRGLGSLVMVLVVLTENNPWETVTTMFRRCAFLMVPLSFLFIRYFRQWGVYYESWGARGYSGVTTGKNPLGRLCLILCFYFFWEIFINRKWKMRWSKADNNTEHIINVLFFGLTFWLLLVADSATSLGCLIIGVCVLVFLRVPTVRSNVHSIGTIILGSIAALFIFDYLFDITGLFIRLLGRDETFTGRTEVWRACLQFVENPLVGVGYDTFWHGERLTRIWDALPSHPIQAHNGYIDVYLQIGIIGLLLLMATLFSIYRNIQKNLILDFELGCFQFAMLVQYLLYNITEEAFKLHNFFWFSLLLVTLCTKRNQLVKVDQ